jgi:hypothetical protein
MQLRENKNADSFFTVVKADFGHDIP